MTYKHYCHICESANITTAEEIGIYTCTMCAESNKDRTVNTFDLSSIIDASN